MRRGWFNLSASYRERLARGGVSRQSYESGASLQTARGHARTPERPGQGVSRPEFQEYYARQAQPTYEVEIVEAQGQHSQEVKDALYVRVTGLFGDRHKFRGVLDPDFPPNGYPPAPEDDEILEILELDDYDLESLAISDPSFWFLWYH